MLTLADWRHFSLAKKLKAWLIVLLAAMYFFYEFIQMNMFNSLADIFQVTFTLSALQVGLVSAFYFLADSLLLYPVGAVLDYCAARKMIILGMLLCILGTILIASAKNSWFLVSARFMEGLAAAFCLLSILRLATQWFPVEKMGQVSGVVVTLGMLGGAVSQAPLTWMIELLGWRHALYGVAAFGLLLLLLILVLVRDNQEDQSFSELQLRTKDAKAWLDFLVIIKNRHNWFNALYVSTMNLPVMILAGLFGTNFMHQGFGFNVMQASSISMMIFMGTIFGSSLLGWLSDTIKARRGLMRISAILSLCLFIFILFGPKLNYFGYLSAFFLLGMISAAQVLSYPVAQELNPRRLVGSVLGFVSVIIMVLPMVLQPLTGWIMDFGAHNAIGGYQLISYQHGLSLLIIGFIVSIICAYALPESYGVNIDERNRSA